MSDMTRRGAGTLVCPECGSANGPEATFCGACGAYLEWEDDQVAAGEPQPALEPAPEPEPVPEPEVAPEPEKRTLVSRLRNELGLDAAPPSPARSPVDAGGAAKTSVTPAATATSEETPAAAQPTARQPAPAQPPPRQPAAVKPAAEATRTRRSAAPTDDLAPRPGETVCGQCGAGNQPDRKFCRRCGKGLAGSVVVPPPPWWRRLFQRQPRTVAAGTRHAVRRRSRLPGRLLTLAVVGAVVFALYRFVWPTVGVPAIEAVRDRTSGTQRYEPTSLDASSSAPDHGAGLARDGDLTTYWMPAPGGEPVGQYVEASFAEPFRLVAVQVFNGASRDDAEYLTVGRPAGVALTITRSDGSEETREVTLQDDPNQQDHLLGVSDVTRLRMTITSTFGDPATGVALGEMAFFTRS